MSRWKFTLLILPMYLFLCPTVGANNIAVQNISVVNQNVAGDYAWIKFDLSWDNSWRTSSGPMNWDAAWVFAKFRVGSGPWQHASLHYLDGTNDGHSAPTGAAISTAEDTRGCFVFRSEDGSGSVQWDDIRIRWDYGNNGVGDNDVIDIQVFAIEMVYVPDGSFKLGGPFLNAEAANSFYQRSVFFPAPYPVNSENQITVGTTIGNLYYADSVGSPGDRLGPIPAAFPKGYDAFYCMKYEASQGQYVSFFNTLTGPQKTTRDLTDVYHKGSDAEVGRNSISWLGGTGTMTTNTPDRPVNYIGSDDVVAYLDWSGLRPMTEMEYEKACRGPEEPIQGEFAWGNANLTNAEYDIVNDATAFESFSNASQFTGNAMYLTSMTGKGGPARVGVLAASAINKNREETGATYYGIMEMSGNLYERCISVGNPVGRAFQAVHGNGALNTPGNANVFSWPSANDGWGFRGASYINQSRFMRVSDRYDAANGFSGTNSRIGFRGVRTVDN